MGYILSKFKRKKSTLEALEAIEKEINRISLSKKQNLTAQHNTVKHIITYGVVFWLGALGMLYYFYKNAKKSDDYLLFLPLVVLIPCLLLVFRRLLTWWYHRKIIRDDKKLQQYQDEKARILDEVMDKETYKVATKILERFDPGRLQGAGRPPTGGGVRLPGASGLAAASATATPPPRPGDPSGMELRKRGPPQQQLQQQQRQQLQLNNSFAAPASAAQSAAQRPSNLNQTLPARPSAAGGGVPGGPPPLSGPGRGGPPLPRPILPRERGYMDKIVEYLVGDGPSNRYALICRQCQSHNGMALREEFEYISYRCCYCHYWNPARKQRPVAPKLPNPALLKLSDPDSSEESSKSEANSRAHSRRSSVVGSETAGEEAGKSVASIPSSSGHQEGADTVEAADRQEPGSKLETAARSPLSSSSEDEEDGVMIGLEEVEKEQEQTVGEKEEEEEDSRATDTVTDQESEHIELINKSVNPMDVDE